MSNNPESVLVVSPVREFAKGWPRFVDGWREALRKIGQMPRFVVVDDGSVDPIPASTENDVTVILNDSAQGLGDCLQSGLSTRDDIDSVLMIVPDFGFRPTDADDLFNAFKDVDMCIGVRPSQGPPGWLIPIQRVGGWLKKWLFGIPEMGSPPWLGWPTLRRRWAYRFRYGPKLQDPGCGLVLVRRSILERCPIQSNGGFALLELIAKANFLGATISEVPMSKPSDMPVMKGRFESIKSDEKKVFRQPTFLAEMRSQEKQFPAEMPSSSN